MFNCIDFVRVRGLLEKPGVLLFCEMFSETMLTSEFSSDWCDATMLPTKHVTLFF